mgnify:CR=1 FL=1
METELTQGLTFLTWTGAGFLIVIGVFTAKLLFDLSRLTVSLKKSADIVQKELDPIMKNVSATTSTLNDFVQTTNKKVSKVSEAYDKASQIVLKTITKASAMTGVALKEIAKGLFFGFKTMVAKK